MNDADIEAAELALDAQDAAAPRERIRRARAQLERARDFKGSAAARTRVVIAAERELAAALEDCPHAAMQTAEGWNREHPDDDPVPAGHTVCLDECGQAIAEDGHAWSEYGRRRGV